MREADSGASAKAIRDALINSANPFFIEGAGDIDQGHGFLDLVDALAILDDDDDSDGDFDGFASHRVKKNIAALGFKTVKMRNGVFSTRVEDLIPGQVEHFFVESRKDTDQLTVTLDNINPALPPAQQNVLFGDDIFLEIVDAPTSFAALRTSSFVPAGPASFVVDNPQTGIVRVAVMGDWTNAGNISTDLIIEEDRNAHRQLERNQIVTRRIDRTTQKVGDKYHVWHTERLWEATKDFPVFNVEIETLKHLDAVCWFDDDFKATLRNVVEHYVRIERVDTDYPIILNPDGQIFDGAHRVAKAMASGQLTIKAVQLLTVPPPDEVVDTIH